MVDTSSLITFRVRAPLNTRSVDLYGSWDNFTMPYQMQRDVRLGGEHWTGNHSYDSIIYDWGHEDQNSSRHVGMKMGGIYWYYYKLDEDIEFHNSAEPATTSCPLLPGHLVNELQVPAALVRARERNASVSSTGSDQRMPNAEDRFMNPRPVPTPKSFRMANSPGMASLPHSSHTSPTTSLTNLSRRSSRENLQVPNMHRLPRMASCEALPCTSRIQTKPAGLRQAFKTLRSGRSESPDFHYKHIIDWKPSGDGPISISAPHTPELDHDAASYFEPMQPCPAPRSRGLLLRTSSDTSVPTTSFLEHRRERSRSGSRGPSSLRGSFSVEESVHLDLQRTLHQRNALETLVEAASPQHTPVHIFPSISHVGDANTPTPMGLEKRLPTLPNTPSSAYPPSTAGMLSPGKFSLQMDGFHSRFSASTVDTECVRDSVTADAHGQLEWSATSVLVSPSSDSTVDDSVASPVAEAGDVAPAIRSVATHSPDVAGAFASEGLHTSYVVSSPDNFSHDHSEDPLLTPTQCRKSQAFDRDSGFQQHYRLPDSENAMKSDDKPVANKAVFTIPRKPCAVTSHTHSQSQQLTSRESDFVHSDSMQQLMQELSYLGDAITQT